MTLKKTTRGSYTPSHILKPLWRSDMDGVIYDVQGLTGGDQPPGPTVYRRQHYDMPAPRCYASGTCGGGRSTAMYYSSVTNSQSEHQVFILWFTSDDSVVQLAVDLRELLLS